MDGMDMEDQNQKPGLARGPASQTIKIFLVLGEEIEPLGT